VEEKNHMSVNRFQYECALSGVTADGDLDFEDDGLGDLPAGWIEVRMTRRVQNPRYALIRQVKQALLQGLASQIPEEHRAGQAAAIQVQLDANFYFMEQSTPIYLTESETVYLAPPESSEAVLESFNQARELLGLEPFAAPDEEDEDE
jgi:hypothetical protein